MQRDENVRKNSLGNYKSAALPTELCRRPPYESRFQRVHQGFVASHAGARAAEASIPAGVIANVIASAI